MSEAHADESVNDGRRKMSPTMKVGLLLAVVGIAFVLMVVDKLRLLGRQHQRRMARLRRAKARRS